MRDSRMEETSDAATRDVSRVPTRKHHSAHANAAREGLHERPSLASRMQQHIPALAVAYERETAGVLRAAVLIADRPVEHTKTGENEEKSGAHFGGGQRSCADSVSEGDSVHGALEGEEERGRDEVVGRRDDPGTQSLPYITRFRAPPQYPVPPSSELLLALAVVAVDAAGHGISLQT